MELVESKRDGDGRWPLEYGTLAMMPVNLMKTMAARAGGTHCAPYECSTGIQQENQRRCTSKKTGNEPNWPVQ